METILSDMDDVEVYIDNIGIFSNDWESHVTTINKVCRRLQEKNFVINPLKCEWAVQETDWLGYWLTPIGLKPWQKKVQPILDLQAPKNVKELRSFIGAINFYCNMYQWRSHVLAPLTALTKTPKGQKLPWSDIEEKAFQEAKAMIARDTLMRYPDHNKPFHIFADASDFQLGAAIFQDGHPVAFYSRKLNSAQRNYTTIAKELLSIVQTLKEYWTTLLGCRELHIHTDHCNLTGTCFNTQRIQR